MLLTFEQSNLLAPDECRRIVDAALASGRLRAGMMKDRDGEDYYADKIRHNQIVFLNDDEMGDLGPRLKEVVHGWNDTGYRCDLSGKFQFQFAAYEGSKGDFIEWHPDEPLWDKHYRGKKLSMVTQLSDPADYEGGVLQVRGLGDVHRGCGHTIIFPSYTVHRVTPVTSGWRYSLVTWAHGPNWR